MYEADFELQQNTIQADLILNVTPDKLSELTNDTGYITNSALIPLQSDILDLQSNKVDKEAGKGLSTNDFTDADKSKLDGIETGAQVNTVYSVNGQTGDVVIEAGSLKWGDLTGTLSDQTDLQEALNGKQDTISDLSTIKSGASKGATALQPNDNITELNNNAGYITGITSGDVTTALGFTPQVAGNYATTDTAQDIMATKTFKTQQKIQSGSADGCLIIGADVGEITLTDNTRKLGRVTLPPKTSSNPNVAIISADTQAFNSFSVLPTGYVRTDTNTVSFGSAPGDTTSTAPDILGFTIAKTHNATATVDKTLALEISKEQAKFNIQPNYNGNKLIDTTDIAAQNGDYGLIKLRSSAYGLGVDSSGYTIINRATTTDIDDKTAYYKPITPINLDYAVKIGVTTNTNTLTDAEKASACSWVGALPNNIYGESTTAAATVQKEVSIPSITTLNAGQLIIVKPTVTSTVANSTLKLNDFDAYPMLYAGSAITTSTDSYVWYANAPVWWLFDGSNWLFAGHGYDYNTTYSAMTQANIIAGTETSGRLMRSDYLKNGIFGVVTSYNSGASITLSDKYLYNNTSNISALTLVAPSSFDERFMAQVNFSSGSTATTFSYPATFKVIDGCDDTQYISGVRTFVPVANKRYQVFITSDGVNLTLMAKGV